MLCQVFGFVHAALRFLVWELNLELSDVDPQRVNVTFVENVEL